MGWLNETRGDEIGEREKDTSTLARTIIVDPVRSAIGLRQQVQPDTL
jgi:hypothetical protein